MGDQWDWIESNCEICGVDLANTSGRCVKHANKKIHKTKEQLQQAAESAIVRELSDLITDIKSTTFRSDVSSEKQAKSFITLIRKINEL
jgi:hypothetical protein